MSWFALKRGRRQRRAWCAVFCALIGCVAYARSTRASASPWSGRADLNLATMVSKDQTHRLGYDGFGFLGGVALSYEIIPWLSAEGWLRGGGFLTQRKTGGVMGTLLGLRVHSEARRVVPYLGVDVGPGLTGKLVRPWYRVCAGLDLRLPYVTLGPEIGFDQVIQWNKPGYSTDAVYLWFGVAMSLNRPVPAPPRPPPAPAAPAPVVRTEEREVGRTVETEVEIERLIERTLAPPPARLELLAPVLFAFDSDDLLPVGVAMLHEVLHTLRTRPEIEKLEVQGYADERGSAQYNQQLSQRRANAVRGWLIEHGVAPARLVVAARGKASPVDSDRSESAYEQNRRVVFRVLSVSAP